MTLWIILAFVTLILIYGLLLFSLAYHAYKEAPKQEMYICAIHGPMTKNGVITVFDAMEYEEDGRTKRGPIEMCVICFEEKIRKAQSAYKG